MRNENLWAPWRMAYLQDLDQQPRSEGPASEKSPCFICEAAACSPQSEDARQRLVLHQDDRGLLMLNKFPYTNGHLLICPSEHIGQLSDLSPQQRTGLMELTTVAEKLLKAAVNPQGLNVGINLGRAAGAGVPGHLHIHVLPRWAGDTNFIQTVGRVRVIPQALEQSYDHLANVLAKLGHQV